MPDAAAVHCFRVIIHGAFSARVRLAPDVDTRGFYTTKWVVAPDKQTAVSKAVQSARRELEQWSDVGDGLVAVDIEAEDVDSGSWWRWLRGDGRGFAFYGDD